MSKLFILSKSNTHYAEFYACLPQKVELLQQQTVERLPKRQINHLQEDEQ